MEDLETVLSLGFATTNAAQALGIALFVSLLMKKYDDVWKFAAFAFLLDRLLPAIFLVTAGGGGGETFSELWRLIAEAPAEMGSLTIRYVSMMVITSFGFYARATLHERLS